MKKVAISEGLGDLGPYFENRGYTVVPPNEARDAAALVVSGMTDNFTGLQKRALRVPVVSAEGQTPAQIFEQVEQAAQILE